MKEKAVGIDSCVEHLDIFKEEANKLENSKNVEVKTICGYYPLKETILKGEVSTVLASLIFHFLCPEDLRSVLKQVLNKLFQRKITCTFNLLLTSNYYKCHKRQILYAQAFYMNW